MSILDLAINWGIDRNARSDDGSTALHEAVSIRSLKAIEALLDRGVDPCIENAIGQTPLAMAVNLRRERGIIDLLKRKTQCVTK
jgi:ankyrin repeat protein